MATKVNFINGGLPEENFAVLKDAVGRRFDEHFCDPEFTIEWKKDDTLRADEYDVVSDENKAVITSGDVCGAFAGAGDVLRKCTFDGNGGFKGYVGKYHFLPKSEIQGMYFCSHFHNFYHDAPMDEVEDVIEDLALRGNNVLMAWYDMHYYPNSNTPESLKMIARLKAIWAHARLTGMKVGFQCLADEAFNSSSPQIRAEYAVQNGYLESPFGHYHVEICPNKKGGLEEIIRMRREALEKFTDIKIDYFVIWPYDQGGCTCAACKPWAANGLLKCVKALQKLFREMYPDSKILLATWFFDRFMKGEWEAFREAVKGEDYDSVEYLFGFFNDEDPIQLPPDFIKRGEFPVGKGMISFPEITMWGATPWGAFGANPTPERWQRNYDDYGSLYCGMIGYSEGIFEDINKAMIYDTYSGKVKDVKDTLREYAKFEYCMDDAGAEDFVKLCFMLNETWFRLPESKAGLYRWQDMPEQREYDELRYIIQDPAKVEEALALTEKVESQIPEKMRNCWRWRIVKLRALIDVDLVKNNFHLSKQMEEYSEALIELFHAENASYSVTPFTRRGIERTKYSMTE